MRKRRGVRATGIPEGRVSVDGTRVPRSTLRVRATGGGLPGKCAADGTTLGLGGDRGDRFVPRPEGTVSRSLPIVLTVFAALSLAPAARAQSSGLGFVQSKRAGVDGVVGMDGPQGVFASPDGRNVYLASYDNTLVVFARDAPEGTLTYLETHIDGVAGVNGLAGAQSVVVSP